MKKIHDHSFVLILASIIVYSFPVFVSGQVASDGSMPQYLFSQFVSGTIRMKNSQGQTQVMNYNTITEKMVFLKGEKYYDLTNPDMVDTITLEGRKFVPAGKSFYEVLYVGKASLYIRHYSSLLPPGKPVGYGGTSQVAATDYLSTVNLEGMQWNLKLPVDYTVVPRPVYWVRKGFDWFDFTTEKQFLKLFPDKAGVLKEYIKTEKIKFDKPESLTKLMDYFNSLQQ
jgi:hypothetical protein